MDFRGRHFAATGVRLAPGCVQRPRVPFAVAAAGPRDVGGQPEAAAFGTLRAQLGQLAEACGDGRDPADLRKLVQLSRIVTDPYASPERGLRR